MKRTLMLGNLIKPQFNMLKLKLDVKPQYKFKSYYSYAVTEPHTLYWQEHKVLDNT